MHRVIAVLLVGTSLAGCSSDMFKSTPPMTQVQLESNPPGADARTSAGPGCKTPCSVSIPAPDTGFSVSYALDKYQPADVQVKVTKNPGDFTTPATVILDPNPVFAELQLAAPPKQVKKRSKKPRAPKAAPAASAVPESDDAAPSTH